MFHQKAINQMKRRKIKILDDSHVVVQFEFKRTEEEKKVRICDHTESDFLIFINCDFFFFFADLFKFDFR